MAEDKKKSAPGFKYTPAKKFCPKCGARMAAHSDRYACGRCSYTEFTGSKG